MKKLLYQSLPNWTEIASYTNRCWTNQLISDEDTNAVFDESADWSNPNAEFTNLEYAVFVNETGSTNTITGRTSPSGPYTMYSASGINELSSTTIGCLNGKHLIGF